MPSLASARDAVSPAAPAPISVSVANLTGLVRERGTRAPLAGVVVELSRPERPEEVVPTESDAEGRFSFVGLEPGTWNVRLEALGYQPFETSESLQPAEATEVVYYLERASNNPFDVTVTALRPHKEVSRTSLRVQQIEKLPGVAGDPLNVVQNLTGVARSSFGTGQIIVRGSAPEDTRVFVDGIEIPLIYHFGGIRSVIPMQMLEGLDFRPGNFGSEYGRATGGIVDVRLRRLEPSRFGGSVDVSLLDTSVYLEAPLGSRGAIALAGRRSYIGDVLAAALPEDELSLSVAPRYYDYQLLGHYRPAAEHELGLFLLGSDDRLELLFESPADIDPGFTSDTLSSSERFYRALLSHRFVPSARFDNTLRLAYGYSSERDSFGQLRISVDTHSLQLRDDVRHELGSALSLAYGVDARLTAFDVFVRAPELPKEGEPAVFDLTDLNATRDAVTQLSPAGYLTAEIEPVQGWQLLPGIRVDHFGAVREIVAQPRLATRLALGPQVTLKGGVGLYAQEPSDDELNADFGNPDLGAERAIHYSLGSEYRPAPHLLVDATVFYKQLFDLVSRTDALASGPEGLAPLRFDNRGSGAAYGAELLLRHELARNFSGWLAYTLSRSVRTDSGEREQRLFDFDQTHILTLVSSYALPRGWQLGARLRFVSGNPRTPVAGAVFNADADRYDAIYGAANSERDAPFHQLDVRIDKRWIFDTWMLNAYLEVQNAYNRQNPEGLAYNYDYRQSTRESGLPLLPVFGLRADF